MNYRRYYLSGNEWIRIIAEFLFIDLVFSYLFYDSYVAFIVGAAGLLPYIKYRKKILLKKRRGLLTEEFIELIGIVSGKMRGGMSCENAFIDSYSDMKNMFGRSAPILIELYLIVLRLNRQESLEACLYDLGYRSEAEDIRDFAEVFLIAKSGSGRIRDVIEDTVTIMKEKNETESEIEVIISGKRLEQKIMCIIPLIIIGFLRLQIGDFISVLYHNPIGIGVMSICLMIYIASFLLAERMADIEV